MTPYLLSENEMIKSEQIAFSLPTLKQMSDLHVWVCKAFLAFIHQYRFFRPCVPHKNL